MFDSICLHCKKEFTHTASSTGKFCSRRCYSSHRKGKPRTDFNYKTFICLNCGKEERSGGHEDRKYCSPSCMGQYTRKQAINQWLETGVKTSGMKDYVLKEQDYRCSICNAPSEWNGKSLVLIMDHIDGNSENNHRSNLRCVCPNCDSQLDTYKSKNKGNGRHFRRTRYAEGRSY